MTAAQGINAPAKIDPLAVMQALTAEVRCLSIKIDKLQAAVSDDTDTMYSCKQTAKLLGKSVRSIQRMIYAGALPAVKVGRDWRIRSADLKKYRHSL